MSDKLTVRAQMWQRDGEWQLLVEAPEWVVMGFARRACRLNHRVWVHNYGGGRGQYSFLLGTQTISRSRRERWLRKIFRWPYPKVVKE